MIKSCDESVRISLKIIFQKSLKIDVFPEVWKRVIVVLVHQKEDQVKVF